MLEEFHSTGNLNKKIVLRLVSKYDGSKELKISSQSILWDTHISFLDRLWPIEWRRQ